MTRMKRTLLLFLLSVILSGIPLTARADDLRKAEPLTESERYDPKYYRPLGMGEGGIQAYGEDWERQLEEELMLAFSSRQDRIDVSQYQLSSDDFATLYWRVLNNHAELFYVSSRFSYYSSNGIVTAIRPRYQMEEAEAARILEKMEAAAREAVSAVDDSMEDYEKALVVHDWLAVNCEYDYQNYLDKTIPDKSHEAYGALADGTAVCDGYAKAYGYIMDKLGFTSYVVSSSAINHAWNLLEIGENYYHVDVTWDDPVWDCIGRANHRNFLLSDTGITETGHRGWEEIQQAADASYEEALWKASSGSIVPHGDSWYYVDNEGRSLMRTSNLLGSSADGLFTFDYWRAPSSRYWTHSYSYLQGREDQLIFNGPKQIYAMSFSTEEVSVLYDPDGIPEDTDSAVYGIYGFRLDGRTMYYAIQSGPNLQESQQGYIQSASIPGTPQLPEGSIRLEGEARYGCMLSAEAAFASEFTGILSYQWYRDGQKIVGETLSDLLLTAQDIGKEITVEATSSDYEGMLRSEPVIVQKAVPVPPEDELSLEGIFGQKLSKVPLPEGYAWAEPDTVLDKLGEGSYEASYCPDSELYEEITIQIKVTTVCGHPSQELRGRREATCTEAGYTGNQTCTVCKEVLKAGEAIPAKGHQFGGWKVTKAATYTEEGAEERTCGICGTKETRAVEKITEPSIETGTTHTVGGTEYKVTEAKTEGSGTVVLAAPQDKKITSVTIKDTVEIGGVAFKITGIEEDAFKGCTKLKSASIGPNVVEIGSGAFKGCTALTKVSGMKNVASIGNKAFYNCRKLTAVGGSKALPKVKSIGNSAFAGCTKLKSVNLSSASLMSIGASAFSGDKALTKVTIASKSLKSIGSKAFYKCSKLTSITLKTTKLKTVGSNALGGISKKASIKVPSSKVSEYKKRFTRRTGFKSTMKVKK